MKRLLAGILLLIVASPAYAGPISLQTTPAGAAAIPALLGGTVITFEGVLAGTYNSLTTSGVTFTADSTNTFWIDGAYAGDYNVFGTKSLHGNYSGSPFNILTFTFASPVSAFGFFWGASDTPPWTLNAYSASHALIESFNLPITTFSNAGDFVGLTGAGIASATLVGTSQDWIFIDNFAYKSTSASVPDPGSTLLLFSMGLMGLGAWRMRRQ